MSDKDNISARWRPLAAYTYMYIVVFDFIIAPILWVSLQAYLGVPIVPYSPLTLQAAGMFHVAMGTVMGVTSYTRGQEKVENIKQTTIK